MSRIPKRQHTVNTRVDAEARSPAGDAFSRLVVQVFRLNGALVAAGDALAGPAGQTTARWQVLAAAEDAPRSVAQIARAMSLTRQSVQRVADRLVADGLATYEENPAHRRAKLLRLTEPGRRALAVIQVGQRAWASALGGEVGEADLRRANEVLARVLALVEARRPADGDAEGGA